MSKLNIVKDLAEKIRQMKLAIDELGELGEPEKEIHMHEEHIPIYKNYEATLLGCLMLDNSAFDVIAERVSACHFSIKNRNIFRAMQNLYENKKPMDIVSVLDEMGSVGYKEIEKYLFDLAKNAPGEALWHLSSIANVVMMNSHEREQDNAT